MGERISLVLGGGGAKGLVHVGVLEGLHDLGYEIAGVTGTSVGAIVAAAFAYYSTLRRAEQLDPLVAQLRAVQGVRALVEQTVLIRLKDMTLAGLRRGTYLEGARLMAWLDTAFFDAKTGKAMTMGALAVPISLTAADPRTGCSVTFSSDDPTCADLSLAVAVRASAAIPGVFPEVPVTAGGHTVGCWDGGTCGNCRFDLALSAGLKTVAVSVTNRREWTNPEPTWLRRVAGVLRRVAMGMSREVERAMDMLLRACEDNAYQILSQAEKDRIVRVFPDVDGISTLDFDLDRSRKQKLFENGKAALKASLGEAS